MSRPFVRSRVWLLRKLEVSHLLLNASIFTPRPTSPPSKTVPQNAALPDAPPPKKTKRAAAATQRAAFSTELQQTLEIVSNQEHEELKSKPKIGRPRRSDAEDQALKEKWIAAGLGQITDGDAALAFGYSFAANDAAYQARKRYGIPRRKYDNEVLDAQ